ncbi:MAG: hypothetical protein R6V44_12460 [Paracoccaceae bacterium]
MNRLLVAAAVAAAFVWMIGAWLDDRYGYAGVFVPAPARLDGFRYPSGLHAVLDRVDLGLVLGPLGLVFIALVVVAVEHRLFSRR